MITLQQLIQRLIQFWDKKGCVFHQGHDLEVGAGTFNPATFLRALGPEPYATAYVEPSRRPSDGRFGQNPNRLQLFHQFQVLIKPAPADIQQLYLQSLEAIGFKLQDHDIRFVHDDWESPTLGAWGLGWEVWCDGMEVSQFTYFQVMASLPLNPISAEITYGLERLCMFIQNVDNIFDIQWNETLTLGDISKQNEVEWSQHNFSEASTEMWKRHFEDYEIEAKQLLKKQLAIPAYDCVIKASHAFNLLDARGVISTTERTGYIGRIRDLSRLVAAAYISSRENLGFPLLRTEKELSAPKLQEIFPPFNPTDKEDFLFEIGSEQLPATFVPIGCRNLEKAMRALLETHELSFENLKVYGTPRRLAVRITQLAAGTADKIIERKGPPLTAAFTPKGTLTPQGEGFLNSLGLPCAPLEEIRAGKVEAIQIQRIKEIEYLFVTLKRKGQSTLQLLSKTLPKLISALEFPKKMQWNHHNVSYARPIRWIVALFGKTVIPFTFGEVVSNRETFGHAQRGNTKLRLETPDEYLPLLRAHHVIADPEERKDSILTQLRTLEKETHGVVVQPERVLPQVVYLTEWPELSCATFDPHFLRIPSEILISEMIEHQKYFPIASPLSEGGGLKNFFIITADNTPGPLVSQGNQKVLSARLSDGVFLYESDLKIPMEEFNTRLKEITFQKELGSVFKKVERLVSHGHLLNQALGSPADAKKVARAALLSKADLASACVKEFPELQGVIGRHYALAQNEEGEVASAIEEHWLPISEGGPLPKTPCGLILSLADKIDNLLAYYSVGLKPTSSSDPYSLRRQTIGIIKMLLEGKYSVDLKSILETCARQFTRINADLIEEILRFITARAKGVFEELGLKKDEVEASLCALCTNPFDQYCKVQALHQFRKTPHFEQLYTVYKRVKGFLATPTTIPFNPSLATEASEKELFSALQKIDNSWATTLATQNYEAAYQQIATLAPLLEELLTKVKIEAEDLAVRENRRALLQRVFAYCQELLDLSKIQQK